MIARTKTININGLDVEFTDAPPTKPGVYWAAVIKPYEFDVYVVYEHTCDGKTTLMGKGGGLAMPVDKLNGFWSGPLIPADEVEMAWTSGFSCGQAHMEDGPKSLGVTEYWNNSRARRVVEGLQ